MDGGAVSSGGDSGAGAAASSAAATSDGPAPVQAHVHGHGHDTFDSHHHQQQPANTLNGHRRKQDSPAPTSSRPISLADFHDSHRSFMTPLDDISVDLNHYFVRRLSACVFETCVCEG